MNQTNTQNRTLTITLGAAIVACTGLASVASAGIEGPGEQPRPLMTATITADNHYALFTGRDNEMIRIGHNEAGAGGDPGPFNWSVAETFRFVPGQNIYIAAWSDDNVAQGLLAQITMGSATFHTGDARWQVFRTNLDRDDNAPIPGSSFVEAQVAIANANNAWEAPHVGGNNGIQPWGTIAGIATNIPWTWATVAGDTDPLVGGVDAGEVLIFRMTNVPTPGAAALLGLGGLAACRRKRAK